MDLSERITRWRKSRGLTKTQLADRVAVSLPAVIQWESGETTPTTDNVKKLAGELAGSLELFYGKIPSRKKKAS